ncbi:putative fibroblast growth factor 1 [Takifugu flavidus]|uniref:Fibroblast growth factor n=1 Tax=Takifugu flavidus TaxID=433684 RepID=A0A5C6MNN9_9TELE|nr:putative fibroblast growth factor 1 [Takifugu flavidus]
MADDGAAAFDVQAVGGGFPRDYRRLTQLYCMNGGHHLQILPDGTVQGLRDDGDAHSKTADTLRIFTSRAGLRCGAFKSCRKLQVCRIEKSRIHFLSATEAVLKLKAVDRGVVVIRGTEAARYLAMNDEGRLYGSPTVTDECYFLEKLEENHYNTYMSRQYQDRNWYVALKKNGKPKLGPRTHVGQKAVFFLPRQVQDSSE